MGWFIIYIQSYSVCKQIAIFALYKLTMRIALAAICLLLSLLGFSQEPVKQKPKKSLVKSAEQKAKEQARKAPITSYKIYKIDRDTTLVDTSLTIKKEYDYNYLRKDNFGLIPFDNEGQPYTTLQYSLKPFSAYPEFGYKAKHANYIEAADVNYYSVATPLTELYFKTVMQQGQSLDALITMNTSKEFNFSAAYKGLRSLGKYINELSSTGNFRFTSSYNTKNKRYYSNFHYTSQDFLNGENGGITTPADFEGKDPNFKERQRLEVYLTDAKSFMKGKRLFLDHSFMVNPRKGANNLYIVHQFNYENKFFEYNQPTLLSAVGNKTVQRFGDSYTGGGINDQVRYNRMYNKVGAMYENQTLGRFQFFIEDFRYNYFYTTAYIVSGEALPGRLNDKINSLGGQYEYTKEKWNGSVRYANAISNQSLTDLDGKISYAFNQKNMVSFEYQKINKLPDHLYNLHQSTYLNYNWYHHFKNEKINSIAIKAQTQWANAELQISNLDDFLYYSDDSTNDSIELVTPKQYSKSIQYLSLKANKEFRWWKLALDNTILYQKTQQNNDILNVPEIVTRNTLYFSQHFFQRALYLQTGVTFNYFTKYYANGYNPVIADFFVQNKKQIGDYSNLDFFINMRIRQTRIFVKAEHFNSAWGKTDTFYAAPGHPYRDFLIRFGLVWNFFQ